MYLASWSGGKDSCLACYRAINNGFNVSSLLHFDRQNSLHGVKGDFVRIQARLSGLRMVQKKVSGDFESVFKETVGGLNGVKGIVFGDIYLEEHRRWIERVCNDLRVEPIFPLWGMDSEEIVNEFINEGFEAIVVSGRKELIGMEWIGKKLDKEFMRHLKAEGLDICGENGEYHTFVISGPLFRGRIDIYSRVVTERDDHWFLNIEDIRVTKDNG